MTWHGDIGKLEVINRFGSGELEVEWRIPDVLSLPGGSEDGYLSTDFSTGGERWRLKLYPNWYKDSANPASGWLRLGLVKYDGGPRKTFHFSVGIRGSGGVENSREGQKEFWGHDEYFWNEYCSRSDLMKQMTRLMPGNVLKIRCVIKRSGAARDNDLRKKEVESSMEQTKTPQKTTANDELESKIYRKQISAVENEKLSIAEEYNCLLGEKLTIVSGFEKENEELPEKMTSLKEQTEGFEKLSDRYCSEMSNYESKITDMKNKFSVNEKIYKEHMQSSLTASSELWKVNEQLKKEVKSLMEQNKNLDEICEEQTHSISKASSELRKACMDYELLKMESLMEQIEILKSTVENCQTLSENCIKRISTLESELISCAEQSKYQEKLTIVSGLKKELESLMEQIGILKRTVENYQTLSENCIKRISTLESELISSAEQSKYQEKLTIVSGLKKDSSTQTDDECIHSKFLTEESRFSENQALFDDDAFGRDNNENNNDENHEESKNEKNVKQLSQVKSTKKVSLPSRHGNVIRSLKAILAGGRRADFTLKSGGREWPVHRSILEGSSRFFETLFRGEWAVRDEVRFDGVAEGALDVVLHFVYTGEAGDHLSIENVCGTYIAAHQFLLEDLKSLCVEYMRERMCPELVCDALVVAEEYGEKDLKESALECFFRECTIIFEMEEWRQFKANHRAIIAELLRENFKRKRAITI